MATQISALGILPETERIDISWEHTNAFFSFLDGVCGTLYGKEYVIREDNKCISIQAFTRMFCPSAKSVAKRFVPRDTERFSEREITICLSKLNKIYLNRNCNYDISTFVSTCVPILDGILLPTAATNSVRLPKTRSIRCFLHIAESYWPVCRLSKGPRVPLSLLLPLSPSSSAFRGGRAYMLCKIKDMMRKITTNMW